MPVTTTRSSARSLRHIQRPRRSYLDRACCSALLLGTTLLLASCGGPKINLSTLSAAEKYRLAMADFEKEDYKEAQEKFTAIIIQDPASEYADDAQYYLGESHFRNEEYLLAAFQFNRLRSNFPNSPYYRQALYRTAEAYGMSSPNFERDQSDTRTAIGQYEAFLRLYPNDSLSAPARQRILELRSKLARKEYSIAEQYWKMEEYRAALVYYERVTELYADTDYNELAVVGRIRALQKLDREQEARDALTRYMKDFPAGTANSQMHQLQMEFEGRR